MIRKQKIPLKIKTMITKQNLEEFHNIKKFIQDLGMRFKFDYQIFPRLNRDLTPCSLRIDPREALVIEGRLGLGRIEREYCLAATFTEQKSEKNRYIFRCAAGSTDGFNVDPYGKMFFCHAIRRPAMDLLNGGNIKKCLYELFAQTRLREFKTDSKCRDCEIAQLCSRCPGKAYLETNDMEAPLEWHCELTHLIVKKANSTDKLLNC
jgi:radical SAM protein with 4Fe4S-binding SPASM domain